MNAGAELVFGFAIPVAHVKFQVSAMQRQQCRIFRSEFRQESCAHQLANGIIGGGFFSRLRVVRVTKCSLFSHARSTGASSMSCLHPFHAAASLPACRRRRAGGSREWISVAEKVNASKRAVYVLAMSDCHDGDGDYFACDCVENAIWPDTQCIEAVQFSSELLSCKRIFTQSAECVEDSCAVFCLQCVELLLRLAFDFQFEHRS